MSYPEPIPTLKGEDAIEFERRLEEFKLTDEQKAFYAQARERFAKHRHDDIVIRKVKVLGDRARKRAEEMGLVDEDLVLVTTNFERGELPEFIIEKIEGSPIEFLQRVVLGQLHDWRG